MEVKAALRHALYLMRFIRQGDGRDLIFDYRTAQFGDDVRLSRFILYGTGEIHFGYTRRDIISIPIDDQVIEAFVSGIGLFF